MKKEIFQTVLMLAVLLVVLLVLSKVSMEVAIFVAGLFVGVLLVEIRYQRMSKEVSVQNIPDTTVQVISPTTKEKGKLEIKSLRVIGRPD